MTVVGGSVVGVVGGWVVGVVVDGPVARVVVGGAGTTPPERGLRVVVVAGRPLVGVAAGVDRAMPW